MITTWIGIDPDYDKNGVCVVKNGEVSVYKWSFTFLIYNALPSLQRRDNFCIFLEAAWKINHLYSRHLCFSNALSSSIGIKIGRNHAVGQKILECAKYHNLLIKEVLPLKKKDNSKLSHDQVVELIRNKGLKPTFSKSNQDERDAITLTLHYLGEGIF